MQKYGKPLLTIVVSLALMALMPVSAIAASRTAYESISGLETGIPTACGPIGWGYSNSSFAGPAHGTINGFWSASVCHGPLSIGSGSASISGGVFHVNGFAGWSYVSISGNVHGWVGPGTEVDHAINGVGTCTETFTVNIVGNGLSFTATLTHYGAFYYGGCYVFSASLGGSGHIMY